MRLPLIKHILSFIQKYDEDYAIKTIKTLEALTEFSNLKDEELNGIGEMLSNVYGEIEVHKEIKDGQPQKKALNSFITGVSSVLE